MNAKLRALFFALVLVATVIGEVESFLGDGQVRRVGRKRSMLKKDKV